MVVFERTTTVAAPLEAVWQFHADIDGLRALTPAWAGLHIERVLGPDGRPDPAVLAEGTEIEMTVGPFGLQRWRSRIVERTREADRAWFVDTAVDGPLPEWRHTHRFIADGPTQTRIEDHVALTPPAGMPTTLLTGGLSVLFWLRHRRYHHRFGRA